MHYQDMFYLIELIIKNHEEMGDLRAAKCALHDVMQMMLNSGAPTQYWDKAQVLIDKFEEKWADEIEALETIDAETHHADFISFTR